MSPHKKPEADPPLPHSLEAERALLGALLVREDGFELFGELVEPSDFFRAAHATIHKAMCELAAAGKAIDLVTLADLLRRGGALNDCGGPAYLASLADGVPRSANAAHYAGLVKEKARLRIAIKSARALLEKAYQGEQSAADLATDAAEALLDQGGAAMPGKPLRVSEFLSAAMESVEKAAAEAHGEVTGVGSGFHELDGMTAGFQPSDLILIAARTSQGKTALALNIARAAASSACVLFFSLEMSRVQLFTRMLSAEARVNHHNIRVGALVDAEWPKLADAITTLSGLNLFIDDTASIGVREVRARARQVRQQHGLGLIVVDYIQLMKGRGKFDTREQEVASFSRGLKAVAKELSVPVVALAQLSRAPEAGFGRKARRPELSDLRESGALESDSDVVLMIYRPEPKDGEEPPVELWIRKQRNGPVGKVNLSWDPDCVRFYDASMV